MALISAQVALQAATQLPEDRMVNTFWFQTNSSADPAGIVTPLVDFYQSLAGALSLNAIHDTGHLIKMYDQADVEPRSPIVESTFDLTGLSNTTALPAEVALCSSFQGNPESGENQQRRRGRIYVSGWVSSNNVGAGRPGGPLQTLLANSTAQLSNDITALGTGIEQVLWVVYSRTADSFALITNGWVDDSWDTQRRRGIAPTTRVTWS